jgi:nucleoside-diphosphate-sugar epimerase
MTHAHIVLAGATGDLGGRISRALVDRGARVTALVRGRDDRTRGLEARGAKVIEVDFARRAGLVAACEGASCVVSALSGLREVVVEAQTALVDAAVEAGCPRFIPSDFSLDYFKQPPGINRNLDLRREFNERLADRAIAATSILNGAFAEMLTGQAPFLLFPIRRALVWENPDQKMDFTAMDDVAAFTAAAALDDRAPRYLRIAGNEASARDLAALATEVTGKPFHLLRAGGLRRLERLILLLRAVGGEDTLYPPWQGMQYMHNMFSGLPKLAPLDNDRYPGLRWTPLRQLLEAHEAREGR